jgi:hypothetical protein
VITRSRLLSVQWHTWGGQERLTVAEEARESLLLADGSWLQSSRESPARPRAVPARFLTERRRWRRFMATHRILDGQLRFLGRTLRLLGPPPRHYPLMPEWTLYLAVPMRRMGTRVFSHTVRAAGLPYARLTATITALLEAPDLEPGPLPDEPIHFAGDLLLQLCRGARRKLLDDDGPGQWLDVSPHHPLPILENEAHALVPETLLPRTLRYVPRRRGPIPAGCWQASSYATDERLLMIYRGRGQARQYRIVSLPDRLYRLLPAMTFGGRIDSLVLDDTELRMPEAILDLGGS